ncbi:sugar ABC transporter substrate-binding protein [Burkholderia sp. A9]|nr:sugar ABC transporter substrate-binding protein [Burkholderia sp. A9]
MKMNGTPTLPVAGDAPSAPSSQIEVPISNIDLTLIHKLREADAAEDAERSRSLLAKSTPYRLGIGDVLQITVWDHPELAAALGTSPQNVTRTADPTQGFVVDGNGNVQFPYIGDTQAVGRTVDELRGVLRAKLSMVFINPQLTVRVASYRAKQMYVDGEVHAPGVQQINDVPMTLYEAISRAGGFTAAADQSRMTLVRDGVTYPLDLSSTLSRGENPSEILLKSGDVLRVAPRDENGVYVLGEVNKPVTAIPFQNGKLSISDAISQAGSINSSTADAAQIYVIRKTKSSVPRVFHLDARSPVSMVLANQFELRPKDIVYVDGNSLVRFSRVLSLLLPAVNAGLTAAIVTK